jgi:hypothetical protein
VEGSLRLRNLASGRNRVQLHFQTFGGGLAIPQYSLSGSQVMQRPESETFVNVDVDSTMLNMA